VYYQGATHYYVMTPTPASLKAFGVLKKVEKHPSDTVRSSNMDTVKLHEYARGVATAFGLPAATPFIKDRNSAQLFDFSSRSQCKLSCKVMEDKGGPQLLVLVVGDALMEPFWPEGLGINRGFLSALDAAYTVQEYFSTGEVSKEGTKKMLKSKDKLFGLMRVLSGHTKKDVLREDFRSYTLLPNSRYLKWKTGSVSSLPPSLSLPCLPSSPRPQVRLLASVERLDCSLQYVMRSDSHARPHRVRAQVLVSCALISATIPR
jgi:hypothetical protein